MRRSFLATWNIEVSAARRAAADEDGIEALVEHGLQAFNTLTDAQLRFEVEDVADLFINDRFRQPKFRNLRAHHATRERVRLEDHHLVAERQQVACDGKRGGPRTDTRDARAIALRSRGGHSITDVVFIIRGNALQAADRNRLLLDASASARRFARSIASAT